MRTLLVREPALARAMAACFCFAAAASLGFATAAGATEGSIASGSRPIVGVVYLRSGDSVAVSDVRPWGQDALRYVSAGGVTDYVTTVKVARIVDRGGNDVTLSILRDRKTLSDPAGIRTSPRSSFWASPFEAPSTRGRGVFVTEVLVVGPDGLGSEEGDGVLFSAGVGGMGPLSPSWSLGAVVHVTTGDDAYLGGDFGFRVRRYLTSRASLDLTVAAFGGESDFWRTDGAGLFGEAAYTYSDFVSVVARVERATWEADLDAWDFYRNRTVELRRDATKFRAGLRLGSAPRWLSVPGVAVGLVAFYATIVERAGS